MWAVISCPKLGKQWLFSHENIYCKHSDADEIICTHCQLTATRIDHFLNGVNDVEGCETKVKKNSFLKYNNSLRKGSVAVKYITGSD